MKKTLLGSAAALTLLTGPAFAGPALDAFVGLMLEGAEVRHTAERVEGAVEVYEGLEISAGGDLVRLEGARLTLTEGAVSLIGNGVRFTRAEGGGGDIGQIDLSVPLAIAELPVGSFRVSEGGVRMSPELCAVLRTPISMRASGLSLGDRVSAETVRLDAVVTGPDAVCALDLTQGLTGFSLSDPAGLGIRVAAQEIQIRTPVTPGLPEVATGDTWSSRLTLTGTELLMNGTVELRADRIEGGARLIGDSLLPLAKAGHTRSLARALLTAEPPAEQLPWADLWNGMREVVGDGDVRVSGLEVTGSGLAGLVGVAGPLDPGSRLDLAGTVSKDPDGLRGQLTLDGSALALIGLDLALTTGPADPSFNTLPPSALLTGAPLNLAEAGLRLSDRGAGLLIGQILGTDPYALLETALPAWVGPEKAALVITWLSGARDGGEAALRAAPTEPVPVLTLGMMGLGDWSVLGTLLNVSR